MPHELMNEQQVAAYLHMDLREVTKLASRGQIPCRRTGGGFQFRKGEIDHWVEERMHTLDRRRLADIERGVLRHHGMEMGELLVCPMIPDEGLSVPLPARTRDGALRDLVALAEKSGLVYSHDVLTKAVHTREDMCSTAMFPQVALPHPRHPLPYDIAESFVVVGLTTSGIPYGSLDGSLTRLFFFICCKDERTHLHVLARLAQMLHDEAVVDDLIESQTPEQLYEKLCELEASVIEHERKK
jgi:PTS system nitrogen regulatory IIA component